MFNVARALYSIIGHATGMIFNIAHRAMSFNIAHAYDTAAIVVVSTINASML